MSLSSEQAELLVREARAEKPARAQALASGEHTEPDAEGVRFVSGRVILSMSDGLPKVTSVQEIEGKKPPVWDEKAGEEYLARVRDKAMGKATEIMAQAMADAETIKRKAYEEGLAQGRSEALKEAAAKQSDMAEDLAQTLSSIRSAGKQAFDRQAADIVQLIRLAVERTLAVEMDQKRAEVLENLLRESLDLIDSQLNLTILVRPGERELLTPLLEASRDRYPALSGWTIRESADLEPGGLWIESNDGIVDNTLNGRWTGVSQILDQLALEREG
ncbi:MAG: FliH/SctL family protein [Desulfocurvibacter africanus]